VCGGSGVGNVGVVDWGNVGVMGRGNVGLS